MSDDNDNPSLQSQLPDDQQTLDAQESLKRKHREPGDYSDPEPEKPAKKASKKAESETGAEGS